MGANLWFSPSKGTPTMKTPIHLLALAAVLLAPANGLAEVVTLTHSPPASGNTTNTDYPVPDGVTAEIMSFVLDARSYLFFVKNGIEFQTAPASGDAISTSKAIAGPATIRIKSYSTATPPAGMVTFRLTPEAFPPDKTIIIAPSTNQFNIALECSTNLVNWASATNGAYGGSLTEAKFFRIKVEKTN